MEDVDRIQPEYPIRHVGRKWSDSDLLSELAIFRYVNICFAKDKVYVMYAREWFEGVGKTDLRVFEDVKVGKSARKKRVEQVLRIYPMDYFYTE